LFLCFFGLSLWFSSFSLSACSNFSSSSFVPSVSSLNSLVTGSMFARNSCNFSSIFANCSLSSLFSFFSCCISIGVSISKRGMAFSSYSFL